MSKAKLYSHTDTPVGKSMTKQSGAQTPADVWRQYVAGQPIPDTPPPQFGDVSAIDYEQARYTVANFRSAFQELPASVRDAFGHDEMNYVDFLEKNAQSVSEDGLDAALRAHFSEPEESPSEAETAVSAQNSATEDESGTEQTS